MYIISWVLAVIFILSIIIAVSRIISSEAWWETLAFIGRTGIELLFGVLLWLTWDFKSINKQWEDRPFIELGSGVLAIITFIGGVASILYLLK